MNFLLTFPTTCAAVYLLRKPIKRWPVVFYLCAIALDTLYLSYPVSWAATLFALVVCYAVVVRKMPREL